MNFTINHEPFTLRLASKYAVKSVVSVAVASRTETLITDHTSVDEDNKFVGILCQPVGWFVSDLLKPHTDRMVDTVADFVAKKKAVKTETQDNSTTE